MHSEISAPVFLKFLIQNDLVLINYHIVPIVILYFLYFGISHNWVGYISQLIDFCDPNF